MKKPSTLLKITVFIALISMILSLIGKLPYKENFYRAIMFFLGLIFLGISVAIWNKERSKY
ncbi:MAG: hypothetical protein US60_C0054G0003 [Microgenomates group bacterium GW2011_GWC1_37_8]|uniref:Uncharacterized protein n=2 Tax=Candidatus Woeseibacteriota TaxID=1752722 RepID=A0A0G0LCS4_9BACT|nr:MAG: hypothetical protein US60_C0054G0003 [Microgenomates group bacterium GW2011_GWC1_37_8]KKQ85680.1 MAG: hypothetical protein UT08_C0005G0131 [Candidatus Woesebacteria bacterium GW2011_GWB1_38_8]OGM21975.1 MAG: hypothetical protein A2863_03245 [Candidatus Woesebacteria bacterium RIFCSPHIGHO2_01_FULL_38_9b]